MSDVKWIKITTDIFNDEKISLIDGMPERDGIIVIWFKLLCMAGKLNNGGVFMLNEKIAYTDEMLATIFRRPLNTVRLALQTFEQLGMIDIINNTYTIPNWEKHQSLDQLKQMKEKTRKRVARHREKQKLLASNGDVTQCNVTVTHDVTESNAIRLEEDKERERDKEKEYKEKEKIVKENTRTLFERLLPDYDIPPMLADKLREWFKYKTERKEPYKEQGMKSLLRQIENNCSQYGEDAIVDLIEDCMANGWKGIIFDRLKQSSIVGIPQRQQPFSQKREMTFMDMVKEMEGRGGGDGLWTNMKR